MDAYQVLGLPKGASKAKVKAAYRRLANKYHPDKNPTPEAEARFKLVKEAYEFLTEGTSSTGSFAKPSRPEPQPKQRYQPPPMHPARVEVWLTFSEAFTGCRAKIRAPHFGGTLFCDVMPGTNHGEIQRLMVTDSYGRDFWVDAEFHVHDPRGFYTLNKFNGETCLYCRVRVSLAEALSEKELELPNIDPHGLPVRLTIPPSAFTDGDAIKVLGAGLRNRRSGRRGPLYVQPLFYGRELAEENYPTLVKLKGRVDELLKAYKYFK